MAFLGSERCDKDEFYVSAVLTDEKDHMKN
jgi:hypothetical protein